MANQESIVDLDQELEFLHQQRRLAADAIVDPQAEEKAAALKSFGYAPPDTTTPDPVGGVLGADMGSVMDAQRKQKNINEALLAGEPLAEDLFFEQASPETRSEWSGVVQDGTGIPTDALYDINSLPPDIDRKEGILKVLQSEFAKEQDIPRDYDYNVRIDPETGGFIFNNPMNKNLPENVNPSGIQWADAKSFFIPVGIEIAGAIGGGTAGSLAGPGGTTTGVVLGESLGTLAWRMTNLQTLKDKGYLPPDYDVMGRAVADAKNTALFSLGGVTAFGLLKRIFGKVGAGNLPLDQDEFLEAYETVQKMDLPAGTFGIDTVPTLMRRAEGARDRPFYSPVDRVQEGLKVRQDFTDKAAEDIRRKHQEQTIFQQEVGKEPFEDIGIDTAAAGITAGDVGRRLEYGKLFQDVSREYIENNPKLIKHEDDLLNLRAETEDVINKVTTNAMDPTAAGAQIRTTIQTAKNIEEKATSELYTSAARAAGIRSNANVFDYTPLHELLSKYQKGLSSQAFGDSQVRKRVWEALESIKQKGGFAKGKPVKPKDRSLKNASVVDADEKSLINNIQMAKTKGDEAQEAMWTDLLRELRLVRRNTIAKAPNGKQAVDILDQAAEARLRHTETFDNDVIRGILELQTIAEASYKKGNKQAYNDLTNFLKSNVIKRTDGTLDVPSFINKLLLDPKNVGLNQGIRRGLRRELYDRVRKETPEGATVPKSSTVFNEWIHQNDNVLRTVFDEDEMRQFSNAGNFLRKYEMQEKNLLKTISDLKNRGVLPELVRITTPETLFDATWRPKELSKTLQLHNAVKASGDDSLIREYKTYIYKDLMGKTRVGGLGDEVFSSQKITDYLNNHGSQLDVWAGKKFSKGLRMIAKALRPFEGRSAASLGKLENARLKAIDTMARAYVGIFTMKGRIMTAVKALLAGVSEKKQIRMLLDPDLLYKTIQEDKFLRDPKVKFAVRELGRIFYREWEDVDASPGEPRRDPLRKYKGYQRDLYRDQTNPQKGYKYGGHVIKNLNMPLRHGYGGQR